MGWKPAWAPMLAAAALAWAQAEDKPRLRVPANDREKPPPASESEPPRWERKDTAKLLKMWADAGKKPSEAPAILRTIWELPPELLRETWAALTALDPGSEDSPREAVRRLLPLGDKGVAFLDEIARGAPRAKPWAEPARLTLLGAAEGEKLFWEKGKCADCHKIGSRGKAAQGPDLAGIGRRAEERAQERFLLLKIRITPTGYLVESMLDPDAYTVKGYPSGTEPKATERLSKKEIASVVLYLQSQGGVPDREQIRLPD